MAKRQENRGKSNSFEIPIGQRSGDVARTALKGWMPVSEQRLFDLQIKAAAGNLQGREDKFLAELRCDIGLYSNLLFSVLQDGVLRPDSNDPVGLMSAVERLSISEISNLINIAPLDVSEMHLGSMSKHQARLIRFAIVSCSSAVLMAERAGVDPAVAYSLGLLRNYNFILLSWNYPSAFSRASEGQYQGFGSLGGNLERILKFNLLEFTFALVKRLRLGDRLNTLILNPGSKTQAGQGKTDSDIQQRGVFEQSVRFCEIGEVIARLSDPEYYPGVAVEWEEVRREVRYFLGKHGIALLNQRIENNARSYANYAPEVFKREIEPNRDCLVAVAQSNLHKFNRAMQGLELPEDDYERFLELYKTLRYSGVSKDTLNLLFNRLLPSLGFEWGCFFIFDPDKEVLIPKKAFGEDIWGYKQNITISTGSEVPRLIFESITSKSIMRVDRVYTDMLTRSHLAWRFGNQSLRGVLYLGSGEELQEVSPKVVNSYFMATRQTLCDILGIENDNSSVV